MLQRTISTVAGEEARPETASAVAEEGKAAEDKQSAMLPVREVKIEKERAMKEREDQKLDGLFTIAQKGDNMFCFYVLRVQSLWLPSKLENQKRYWPYWP